VFQPLEVLNSFTLASALATRPKLLQEQVEKQVDQEQSKSIIQLFLQGSENSFETILSGEGLVKTETKSYSYEDNLLVRNLKDIQMEGDMKNFIQHCITIDSKTL